MSAVWEELLVAQGWSSGPPLVRPYAITGGRTRPATDLPMEALVSTTARGMTAALTFERLALTRLAVEGQPVAELAARLDLPLGVTRVLVADLAAEELVEVTEPPDEEPTLVLLERVLDGLRAL